MENKLSREEEKKLREEEKKAKEKEISDKISEIDSAFKSVKLKKENLKVNFKSSIKDILALWRKKIKNDSIISDLYLATAKMIEFALSEKDLIGFQDGLTSVERGDLVKFFYMTYERITKKENCLSIKASKIYNIHQSILSKEGVGVVSRAMFSIQK